MDLMCITWPVVVNTLMCSSLIQLMDSDLATDTNDGSSNDNDVGNNEFSHGVELCCAVPISTGGNDQSQALHLAWEL